MEVKINSLGINGEGVFRFGSGEYAGKVGFLPYALPDEVVDVTITKNKSKFCECKLNKIIEKSIDRVEPKCPYFQICGGCDLQHLKMDKQLEFKKQKVVDSIKKIAKTDVKIENIVHLNDFYYRNKMVFPFVRINGKVSLGMFKNSSHEVVEIDNCMLAMDRINEVLDFSKKYFSDKNIDVYDFIQKNGVYKYLVVRTGENGVLTTLVVSKKIDTKDFYDFLKKKFKNVGVSIIISDSDDEILSGKFSHEFGIEKLEFDEFGIKYSVDNRGFLQVNNEVKKEIYNRILSEINISDCVIDAYSGAGLLTCIMAKKSKFAVGIEINNSSHKSALNMADFNCLHNTMFINNDVKNAVSEMLDKYPNSVLVLDPARSGCDESVLQKILSSVHQPKKIIYLSCNVATLARDLIKLTSFYEIKNVILYDLFPNTKHVETLVCMQRRI